MKTEIFKDYSEFIQRPDKEVNGVSPEFAAQHPDYEKQNETNKGCWNCSDCSGCSDCSRCSGCSDCSRCSGCSGCSDCSDCSGCSDCSDCSDCSRCSDCSGCSGCSDCSGCSGCSGCSDCSDCSDCSRCSDCSGLRLEKDKKDEREKPGVPETPIIEDIHQKVYEAVSRPEALNMGNWHDNEKIDDNGAHCGTTHCRAGWVIFLAGTQGRKLEKVMGTQQAAMNIYHKSSPNIPVAPQRFFETNEQAMADMKRCAEEEANLNNNIPG